MKWVYKIAATLREWVFVRFRIWKYGWLSSGKHSCGKPVKFQPVLLCGKGRISFGENVQIGVINSPGFYTGYAYIEARNADALIQLGNRVSINNSFSAIALGSTICIEDDVLIGINCQITDSDFHNIDPDKRKTGIPVSKPVIVKRNVFIGNNVTILKGVTIGENSIIASGAVVTGSIPDHVIAGGVPAVVLKSIHY